MQEGGGRRVGSNKVVELKKKKSLHAAIKDPARCNSVRSGATK